MAIRKTIRKIIELIFPTIPLQIFAVVAAGIICGLAGFIADASRATSYLSDDPSVCVNCHIMAPYYASWEHSSHSRNAVCNDCHVPHQNAVQKWLFKGEDGLRHAAVFTMRGEPQVIRAIDASAAVVMENCIRCHTQMNSEFVKTGKITYNDVKAGEGKACWDCHQNAAHGKVSSLSSAPSAIVPYPKTIVPHWLENLHKKDAD